MLALALALTIARSFWTFFKYILNNYEAVYSIVYLANIIDSKINKLIAVLWC